MTSSQVLAPTSPTEWPNEVKLFLGAKIVNRTLQQHEGWEGVCQWLYAGTERPDGSRLPYAGSLDYLWGFIVADAAAWNAERKARVL